MIGERIREMRDKRGLDNKSLAKSLNASEPTIKAWVSGNNLASFIKLKRLAEELGSTPNEILGVSTRSPVQNDLRYQNLVASIEGAFRNIGLDQEEASRLTKIVEECADEQLSPGPADPLEIRKHIAEIAIRRFLKRGGGQS